MTAIPMGDDEVLVGATDEWLAGLREPGAPLTGELIDVRVPSFVHLGDDVWVNPALVACVRRNRYSGSPVAAEFSIVEFGAGGSVTVERPVLEVLALLTDEAEL